MNQNCEIGQKFVLTHWNLRHNVNLNEVEKTMNKKIKKENSS